MQSPTTSLLHKLRIKFIALNMGLAFLVLAIAFAAICTIDYNNQLDETYLDLEQAVNRVSAHPSGTTPGNLMIPNFPRMSENAQNNAEGSAESVAEGAAAGSAESVAEGAAAGSAESVVEGAAEGSAESVAEGAAAGSAESVAEGDTTANQEEEGSSGAGESNDTNSDETTTEENSEPNTTDVFPQSPQIGAAPQSNSPLTTPIAIYALQENGAVHLLAQSNATVSESLLDTAAQAAQESSADHGFLNQVGLYFWKNTTNNATIIAFADSSSTDNWKSLAFTLSITGVGALSLLLLLNLFFSRWALGPVQQAWTQQQQFIADASHELKTPLTVILANTSILRKHRTETVQSQEQWVESTQVEAERMQTLVADMLDLARPADANAQALSEHLDLSRLVEGEALTFESVAFEREINWESSLDENVFVTGSSVKLERLVDILFDNACKYTESGGLVKITLKHDDRFAVLSVRNTGDVIDPEDLNHLFDRFYRTDKARTRSERGGYGLGLAIAQDITSAHKGSLTVTSNATDGTTFILRLPLASH
jgi:signal transduction histidine kinase